MNISIQGDGSCYEKTHFSPGLLLLVALTATVYSHLNQSYITNFGYGSIVAYRYGAPDPAKFYADQFNDPGSDPGASRR